MRFIRSKIPRATWKFVANKSLVSVYRAMESSYFNQWELWNIFPLIAEQIGGTGGFNPTSTQGYEI